MNTRLIKILCTVILLPGLAAAEENDFMEDYSILGAVGEYGAARMYVLMARWKACPITVRS